MSVSAFDLRKMQELAQRQWRESPRAVDLSFAELAYAGGMGVTNRADVSSHRLWLDGARCLAFGWFFPPSSLEWAVDPEVPDLLEEVLDWFEPLADGRPQTSVRDGDSAGREFLRRRGYIDDASRPWLRRNHRMLDELEEPALPPGYAVRSVADYGGAVEKRIAVHRRSWAELGTRAACETYPAVMATWPYRPDLDLVLEADDGTPVAFALGWYDEQNAVGAWEPLGTDPDYRNRGLGRALLLAALHRFREVGAREAIVGSRGDAGHPIPSKLYESVGFRRFSRQLPLVRA